MKTKLTVRSSRMGSALAVVVGTGMIVLGLTTFSDFPRLFMVVWLIAAAGIVLYHAFNLVSGRGAAAEVLEGEVLADGPETRSAAARLEDLEHLRSKRLISQAEYDAKRNQLMNEL